MAKKPTKQFAGGGPQEYNTDVLPNGFFSDWATLKGSSAGFFCWLLIHFIGFCWLSLTKANH
jgi:hypothetical protein